MLGGALLIALHMLVEFGALSILGLQTFTTAIYQQFELEFSNEEVNCRATGLPARVQEEGVVLVMADIPAKGVAHVAYMCSGANRRRSRKSAKGWPLSCSTRQLATV